MGANPSALLRLWSEFDRVEPDARLNGIYVGKRGYHNTRANHLAGRDGGSPSDYSVTDTPLDLQGPADKAAAIDINLESARLRSDFRNIAKYSKRLLSAFQSRDARLFHDGKPVVREFFGNTDLDRDVEGWSLFRNRSATSDDTHLWHIHISFHRWAVENWAAVSGVLAVLLDVDTPQPEPIPEDDMPTAREIVDAFLGTRITLTEGEQARYAGYPPSITVRSLLVHAGAGTWDMERQQAEGIEQARYDALLFNVQQAKAVLAQIAAKVDPPTPDDGETSYVVVAGDTLGSIAAAHGVSVVILAERNNISDPDRIFVGQVLVIPGTE